MGGEFDGWMIVFSCVWVWVWVWVFVCVKSEGAGALLPCRLAICEKNSQGWLGRRWRKEGGKVKASKQSWDETESFTTPRN